MDGRPEKQPADLPWEGRNLDDPEDFEDALWHALSKSDLPLLKELLARDNALLTQANQDFRFTLRGDTILHEAARESTLEIVRHLVDRGADVNAHDESVIGDTPLDAALRNEQWDTLSYLVQSGANPNIPTWMWRTSADRAVDRLASTNRLDEAEAAALHAVVSACQKFPPPTYPDGTVPEVWPPLPGQTSKERIKPPPPPPSE